MNRIPWIIAAFFGLGVFSVSAQEGIFHGPAVSYTYLDLGYEGRSFDSSKIGDGDGAFLAFSYGEIPFLYFAGEAHWSRAESFITGDDIDFVDGNLGLGLRFTALDTLSVYLEGGLAYRELDIKEVDDFNRDDLGFYLEPGIKLGVIGRLELNAGLRYTQLDDDALLGGRIGGVIGLTRGLGITLDAGVDEDSHYFGVGLRINW